MRLLTTEVLRASRPHPPASFSWTDKWKKDAVRLLIFEAALGQRDFTAAMQVGGWVGGRATRPGGWAGPGTGGCCHAGAPARPARPASGRHAGAGCWRDQRPTLCPARSLRRSRCAQ